MSWDWARRNAANRHLEMPDVFWPPFPLYARAFFPVVRHFFWRIPTEQALYYKNLGLYYGLASGTLPLQSKPRLGVKGGCASCDCFFGVFRFPLLFCAFFLPFPRILGVPRREKPLLFFGASLAFTKKHFWGESKGCLIKGCLNSTETPKVGIRKAGIPKMGIPKTGIPKAGIPKAGQTHTGTLPETEIPKPGIPKSEIPKTGIPKAGIPKLGIPKTGRFTDPLSQTPLRLPLSVGGSGDFENAETPQFEIAAPKKSKRFFFSASFGAFQKGLHNRGIHDQGDF